MIAITFALPTESSAFLRRVGKKTTESHNGVTTVCGWIKNKEIVILHTGVGEKICRYRLENLLQETRVTFLIGSGFAGAVREDLQVGDLILAENFSDPQLLSVAQRILKNRAVHTAKLFSSKTIIDSLPERSAMAQRHGAAAVDMESEIIANACRARGIPLLSLRVISDTSTESLPAPPNVLFDVKKQKTSFLKLSLYLLKHPNANRRLFRFARQIRLARENLADALVTLLGSDFP
jgi:adenosylhomocysteine nucleosidase